MLRFFLERTRAASLQKALPHEVVEIAVHSGAVAGVAEVGEVFVRVASHSEPRRPGKRIRFSMRRTTSKKESLVRIYLGNVNSGKREKKSQYQYIYEGLATPALHGGTATKYDPTQKGQQLP